MLGASDRKSVTAKPNESKILQSYPLQVLPQVVDLKRVTSDGQLMIPDPTLPKKLVQQQLAAGKKEGLLERSEYSDLKYDVVYKNDWLGQLYPSPMGKGTFGTVHAVCHLSGWYVLKKYTTSLSIDEEYLWSHEAGLAFDEIKLQDNKDKGDSKDTENSKETRLLLMNFLPGYTLDKFDRTIGTRERDRVSMLRCKVVLSMMKYFGNLHHLGIIHRDIKPKNLIVTPGSEVVACDFGSARKRDADKVEFLEQNVPLTTSSILAKWNENKDKFKGSEANVRYALDIVSETVGTPLYAPPEAIRPISKKEYVANKVNEKLDAFSIGMVGAQLFNFVNPSLEKATDEKVLAWEGEGLISKESDEFKNNTRAPLAHREKLLTMFSCLTAPKQKDRPGLKECTSIMADLYRESKTKPIQPFLIGIVDITELNNILLEEDTSLPDFNFLDNLSSGEAQNKMLLQFSKISASLDSDISYFTDAIKLLDRVVLVDLNTKASDTVTASRVTRFLNEELELPSEIFYSPDPDLTVRQILEEIPKKERGSEEDCTCYYMFISTNSDLDDRLIADDQMICLHPKKVTGMARIWKKIDCQKSNVISRLKEKGMKLHEVTEPETLTSNRSP